MDRSHSVMSRLSNLGTNPKNRATLNFRQTKVTHDSPVNSGLRIYETNLMEQMFRKKVQPKIPNNIMRVQSSTPPAASTACMKKQPTAYIKPTEPENSNFASGLQIVEQNCLLEQPGLSNVRLESCNLILTDDKSHELRTNETSILETIEIRTEEDEQCQTNMIYKTQPKQEAMSVIVQNTCKSARVMSRQNSQKRMALNKSMGAASDLQADQNFTSFDEGQELRKSDSETSTVQNLPYLTKQPTGTLSNTRKEANRSRSLLKNKSKSFSDIQHILAQRGSKCVCFDNFGAHQSKNLGSECGTFCKKLGPMKQRQILLKIVQQEHTEQLGRQNKQNLELPVDSMMTDFSREEISGLTPMTKDQVSEEDKRFLISAKWWHEWCNYSGFNEAQLFELTCSAQETDEGITLQENDEHLYPKPGFIYNRELLMNESQAKSSFGQSGALKENIVLHFDYIYVTKAVWTHLYSWFSADYTIFRYLKPARGPLTKRVLDLNMPKGVFK